MHSFFKNNISILGVIFISVFTFNITSVSALDCSAANLSAKDAIQCGVNGASNTNQNADQSSAKATSVVKSLINLLSVIVGVAAVIMLIFGGFRYVTSGGNDTAVASAKNTILYAIIGLVIVALAQLIVQFVLTSVTQTEEAATTNTNGPGSSNDRLPSQKQPLID